MLESVFSSSPAAAPVPQQAVLKMVKNERMGGSVPVWVRQPALETSQTALAQAGQGVTESFADALSYAGQTDATGAATSAEQEFGFGDLLDMMNPLQHLPLIGTLYRSLTGDDIRPAARVVGASLYTGPVGAGMNLVNVMLEHETGKDLAGNMLSLVRDGKPPSFRTPDLPEPRLDEAARIAAAETPPVLDDSAPDSVLSFADMGHGKRKIYDLYSDQDDRMAGRVVYSAVNKTMPAASSVQAAHARQPITTLSFSALPPRQYND